jgi:hypothetical protein
VEAPGIEPEPSRYPLALGYPRVIFQSIATIRRAKANGTCASFAGKCRHAIAMRRPVSVSFALPAAEYSRAFRFPDSCASPRFKAMLLAARDN